MSYTYSITRSFNFSNFIIKSYNMTSYSLLSVLTSCSSLYISANCARAKTLELLEPPDSPDRDLPGACSGPSSTARRPQEAHSHSGSWQDPVRGLFGRSVLSGPRHVPDSTDRRPHTFADVAILALPANSSTLAISMLLLVSWSQLYRLLYLGSENGLISHSIAISANC